MLFSVFRLVAFKHSIKLQNFSLQGMEVDNQECGESDPEQEGQPDNEVSTQKGADGEEEMKEEVDGEGEESGTEEDQQEKISVEEEDWHTCSEGEEEEGTAGSSSDSLFRNSSRLLRKDELLDMFKAVHNGPRWKDGQLTVGLVGNLHCTAEGSFLIYLNLERILCRVRTL